MILKTLLLALLAASSVCAADNSQHASAIVGASFISETHAIRDHKVDIIVHQTDDEWIFEVCVVMKDMGESRIPYQTVTLRAFDNRGTEIPTRQQPPSLPEFVESTESGITSASGGYVAHRKEGRRPARVELTLFGQVSVFPLKKLLH